MRRNIIDNVKIVEPPIEELTKKRSGLRRTCLSGCAFLVLIIIGLFIFIRAYTGPGPQTLKKPPESFPKDIPVYDPDSIEKITFISGKYKNRSIEIAAIFPKIILTPLFLALNKENAPDSPNEKKISLKEIWKILSTPVGDHRDTVQIEWENIEASPKFVISYYKLELRNEKFTIDIESEGQGVSQFSFSREDGISGSFYLRDENKNQPGTEYLVLTVNLPPESK